MPYKTGSWGIQAKERNTKRLEYFRKRALRNYRNNYKGDSLGYSGEIEAGKIFKQNKLPNRMVADFKVKGKLIDVKTALPSKTKGGNEYWKYYLKKQKGKIDYFLFICKNKDKTTQYMFLIPDKELLGKTLNIPIINVKKYLKYLMKAG